MLLEAAGHSLLPKEKTADAQNKGNWICPYSLCSWWPTEASIWMIWVVCHRESSVSLILLLRFLDHHWIHWQLFHVYPHVDLENSGQLCIFMFITVTENPGTKPRNTNVVLKDSILYCSAGCMGDNSTKRAYLIPFPCSLYRSKIHIFMLFMHIQYYSLWRLV